MRCTGCSIRPATHGPSAQPLQEEFAHARFDAPAEREYRAAESGCEDHRPLRQGAGGAPWLRRPARVASRSRRGLETDAGRRQDVDRGKEADRVPGADPARSRLLTSLQTGIVWKTRLISSSEASLVRNDFKKSERRADPLARVPPASGGVYPRRDKPGGSPTPIFEIVPNPTQVGAEEAQSDSACSSRNCNSATTMRASSWTTSRCRGESSSVKSPAAIRSISARRTRRLDQSWSRAAIACRWSSSIVPSLLPRAGRTDFQSVRASRADGLEIRPTAWVGQNGGPPRSCSCWRRCFQVDTSSHCGLPLAPSSLAVSTWAH